MDSGFRRKDGGWRRQRQLAGNGRRGGDVDSGFRRKDGGWRRQRQLAGNGHREATWIPAFAGKTVVAASTPTRGQIYVEALRLSPACCLVRLYRSRELRAQRFVYMGHTEHCLFVEGPSRNLKPDGQALGV